MASIMQHSRKLNHLTGGTNSQKFKQLTGACPAAVQYPEDLREELGEFTDQINPISLEDYLQELRNNRPVPPGLDNALKRKNYQAKDVMYGLPMCKTKDGKPKFCTVIDGEGNVCMHGLRSNDIYETKNRLVQNKRKRLNSENVIMKGAYDLKKYYEGRGRDDEGSSEKLKKLEKLISDYNNISDTITSIPESKHLLKRAKEHLIRGAVTEGDNPTGGCGSVFGPEFAPKYEIPEEDQQSLGDDPQTRKKQIPLTKLEKKMNKYGLGRVPVQLGTTAQSVVCVPPSNEEFQKRNPIFTTLLKRVEKMEQDKDDLNDGTVAYENDNVVEHVTKAFVCADLNKEQCESDVPYAMTGTKVPFGRMNHDPMLSNNDLCEWSKIPNASKNKAKQCIPKLENVKASDKKYGKPYWNWYDTRVIGQRINGKGNYNREAEKKMKNPDNKIQYNLQTPRDIASQSIDKIAKRALFILKGIKPQNGDFEKNYKRFGEKVKKNYPLLNGITQS